MSRTTVAINKINENLDKISGLTGQVSQLIESLSNLVENIVDIVINLDELQDKNEELQARIEKQNIMIDHEIKPELSEAERVILENIDKDYKWIARDEDGCLVLHSKEPQKEYMCNTWMYDGAEHDILTPFNHLFQFITWENDEPYNIEELLKN